MRILSSIVLPSTALVAALDPEVAGGGGWPLAWQEIARDTGHDTVYALVSKLRASETAAID
jgi:hypothetical protein